MAIKYTYQVLSDAVSRSSNMSDVCRYLGVYPSGGIWYILRDRIKEFGIDISHFARKDTSLEGRSAFKSPDQILTNGKKRREAAHYLRRAMIANGILYTCSICPTGDEWNGQPLTLHVDHINGDWSDCRIHNLRFLCPNCHTQTPNYGPKQLKKNRACSKCGRKRSKHSIMCLKCSASSRLEYPMVRKHLNTVHIEWPPIDELNRLVWEKPLRDIASSCGASANGLKKHCKRNGVHYPPMGYWRRRQVGYTHEESLLSHKRIHTPVKHITKDQLDSAIAMILEGTSIRKAARSIGFCHSTLAAAIKRRNDV